jgi:hypothetical protein
METTQLDVFNNLFVNELRKLVDLRYITRSLFTFKFTCFMTRVQTFFHLSTSRKLEIVTALCAVRLDNVLSKSQKKVENRAKGHLRPIVGYKFYYICFYEIQKR